MHITFPEFKWGTEVIEADDGSPAVRFNFLDEPSGTSYSMAWTGLPLEQVIEELAQGLDQEARNSVAIKLQSPVRVIPPARAIPGPLGSFTDENGEQIA